MTNINKEDLLNTIRRCSFAITDLALYLDTHPECVKALQEYQKHKEKRAHALAEYEHHYGPLSNLGVNTELGWAWTDGPWPWQKECD